MSIIVTKSKSKSTAIIDGLQFNNIKLGGTNQSLKALKDDNPWKASGEYNSIPAIVNGIDIDWNGAQVEENVEINNTAELLNWIKNKTGQSGTNGEDGQDGQDGKSAYELAVDNGFVGSVEQWLASLKGQDGSNGTNGSNGQDGKDGEDGKSAYELYLDTVEEGETALTLEQWLASLKGEQGPTGSFDPSDLQNYASKTYVNEAIQNVVGAAPEALDTLKEIADILDNDTTGSEGIIQHIAELDVTKEKVSHMPEFGYYEGEVIFDESDVKFSQVSSNMVGYELDHSYEDLIVGKYIKVTINGVETSLDEERNGYPAKIDNGEFVVGFFKFSNDANAGLICAVQYQHGYPSTQDTRWGAIVTVDNDHDYHVPLKIEVFDGAPIRQIPAEYLPISTIVDPSNLEDYATKEFVDNKFEPIPEFGDYKITREVEWTTLLDEESILFTQKELNGSGIYLDSYLNSINDLDNLYLRITIGNTTTILNKLSDDGLAYIGTRTEQFSDAYSLSGIFIIKNTNYNHLMLQVEGGKYGAPDAGDHMPNNSSVSYYGYRSLKIETSPIIKKQIIHNIVKLNNKFINIPEFGDFTPVWETIVEGNYDFMQNGPSTCGTNNIEELQLSFDEYIQYKHVRITVNGITNIVDISYDEENETISIIKNYEYATPPIGSFYGIGIGGSIPKSAQVQIFTNYSKSRFDEYTNKFISLTFNQNNVDYGYGLDVNDKVDGHWSDIPVKIEFTKDENVGVRTVKIAEKYLTLDSYVKKTDIGELGNIIDVPAVAEELYTAEDEEVISGTKEVGDVKVEAVEEVSHKATVKEYVDKRFADLINEAPSTLDTLKEIADALNDNATMQMVSEAITTKANSADVYTKTQIDTKIGNLGNKVEAQDAVYEAVENGTTLTEGETYYTSNEGAGEFTSDGTETANGSNYFTLVSEAVEAVPYASVAEVIIDNEEVLATALTDLQAKYEALLARVIELEGAQS